MKKRTAFIGAISSSISLAQTLIIKTSVVLSSIGLILFVSETVKANNAEYYIDLARKYFQKGDFYSAIYNLNEAINLNPDFADAYVSRCGAKLNLQMNEEAIKDCQKAIAMNILNPSIRIDKQTALNNLCGAKLNLGDNYGAISDCDKALLINNNYDTAYRNRGIAKERIGDLQGACSDWRKASSLGSRDAFNWVRDQC